MKLPKPIQRAADAMYSRRIRRGLDRAYDRAGEPGNVETIKLADLKAVIFSDHHRGTQDGADDFRHCEHAYRAALGWYLQNGWSVWLLGDVEELWENRPGKVIECYRSVLALEREFGRDRLWRFFGNHDMAWRRDKNFDEFLKDHLPEGTVMRESVKVRLVDESGEVGILFLTHGHQGTLDSGNLLVVPFSRFTVRTVWATLQRSRGFANTLPSQSNRLRKRHDLAMFAWAKEKTRSLGEHPVLIAGHTHHPVFPDVPPPDLAKEVARLKAALEEARRTDPSKVARARADYELARSRQERDDGYVPPDVSPPCYFNTGCCSFGDGDITGIELDGAADSVRLVRWLDNNGDPIPHQLAPRPSGPPTSLRATLQQVRDA